MNTVLSEMPWVPIRLGLVMIAFKAIISSCDTLGGTHHFITLSILTWFSLEKKTMSQIIKMGSGERMKRPLEGEGEYECILRPLVPLLFVLIVVKPWAGNFTSLDFLFSHL